MKDLIKSLFYPLNKEAWNHCNLQPKEPTFRVNWHLYDRVVQARGTIGPAEIQQRQFAQMVRLKSEKRIETITP
jgi:hypothetical protein